MFKERNLEEYEKISKKIGEVYAIITSKGYAIGQVAGVEESAGTYICRIFSKLYKEIPLEIEDIIKQKENYLARVHLPSMARTKVKMAKKLGMYAVPDFFKMPEYTKNDLSFGKEPPFKYWYIVRKYGSMEQFISLSEWVKGVLNKDLYDRSWLEDFIKLNDTSAINGPYLIEKLEEGWSLEKWVPSDIKKSLKKIWKEIE